jgi:hypothetical protein
VRTPEFLLLLLLASSHCGGPPWTHSDAVSATHAVQLSQRCDALCASDAGCPSEIAAGCFEAIGCNLGSMLHRHGEPDRDAGQECRP